MTNLSIKRTCWVILITSSGALPTFGQTSFDAGPSARHEEGACAIHGRVVKQATGTPLKGASLELIAFKEYSSAGPGSSSAVQGGPGAYAAESLDDGSFCFRTVAPNAYVLTATKPGFLAFHYGAKNYLQSGSIVVPPQEGVSEDLELALRPLGSIEGTVTDASGDPIPDLNVVAIRQAWLNGSSILVPMSGTTDELGRYRIPLLEPAKYFVYAEPLNRGAEPLNREVSSPPLLPSKLIRNVRTYYPSASSLDTSIALTLVEGEAVRGADIRVIKAKTFHVKGRAVGADVLLGGKVKLALSGEESNPLVYRDTDLSANGSFDVPEVAPGKYTLTVFSYSGAGSTQLEISSEDVSVTVPIVGNSKLHGEIRIDGDRISSKTSSPDATVELIGLDASQSLTYLAKIDSAGKFLFDPIRPGKYFVVVTPTTGLYVKSLTAADMELADGELDLINGAPITLTIVLKQGQASVVGSIDSGSSDGGAERPLQILLIPFSRRGTSRVYTGVADSSGHFSITQVPPGKYRALTVEPLQLWVLSIPSLAGRIAALGKEVDLNENEIKAISLDVVTSDTLESLIRDGSF
ncbi:MAG: carboxypeptidase regulatory-like domain-containing protein [Terracidiphilus sp.]